MLTAISLAFLLFSQTTVGKSLLLPAGLIEAVRNFFASNPELRACDYKDGEIILIKPVATGVGEGRYEAGDIVEIRDGEKLCQRLGTDKPMLGKSEIKDYLVVYYPHKLADSQKQELVEPEYATSTDARGEIARTMVKRRQEGVDYTKFLSDSEILKIRQFETLDKLPEIDLSPIIKKTPEQKSVVQVPKYIVQIESIKRSLNKIVRKIIPPVFAQTETVKVVDPGGGTGYDYLSLNAWEGQDLNLVTANIIEIAKCRSTGGVADEMTGEIVNVTIAGWTTDADHYIKIWTDPAEGYRHNGKWDTSKYRLIGSIQYNGVLVITEEYVRVEGLQIENTAIKTWKPDGIVVNVAETLSSNIRISHNIIKASGTGVADTQAYGYKSSAGSGGLNQYFWNNIIYDWGTGWTTGYTTLASNIIFYNNTVIDSAVYGIEFNPGNNTNTRLINTLIQGSATNYYLVTVRYSSNNISEDSTSINADFRNKIVNFVDEANDDFHLSALDKGAVNQGKNLSNDGNLAFTDDIDGQTRPSGSGLNQLWDIGADQTLSATIINTPLSGRFIDSSLVGYWSFNGEDTTWPVDAATTTDLSGNNNDGLLRNMNRRDSPAIGINGQGLNFIAAFPARAVEVGTSDSFFMQGNSNTFSAWIYPRSLGGNSLGRIMSRGAYINLQLVATSTFRFDHSSSGGSPLIRVAAENAITFNTWQHVVVTWDGSGTAANVHLYVNGVETGYYFTQNGTLLANTAGQLTRIGNTDSDKNFDGIIDEVRIYNRILSQSEITDLYRAGAATMKVNTPITLAGAQSGLVGNWTFNGQDMNATTALDRSGQGNNGDVRGGATPVPGISGQALSFDGVNDYVNAGDINAMDGLTKVTVSAWTKYSLIGGLTSEKHMVDKSDCNGVATGNFELVGGVNTAHKVNFVVLYTDPGFTLSGSSITSIDDGKWHHIVGTYDGNRVRIYVDGFEENSAALSNKTLNSLSNFEIGGNCNGIGQSSGFLWPGLIDEVRVYNRALSQSEITDLYRLGGRRLKF